MKAAYCTNSFKHEEIPAALQFLKDVGYHGVEFWHQYLAQTDIKALKKRLDDLGLETAQVCPYFNVTGTAQELQDTYEIAKTYIEYANLLDCKMIRVFTGKGGSRDVDEKIYRQGVEGLQTICDIGRDKLFVLETHDGSLMDTSPATLRLIRDVARENLKVNLQVPLDYGKEDVYESANLLGEHVVHLHAHNWIGGWADLTYLSEGDYDFKKFVRIVKDKGFDGYVSIEHGTHRGKHDVYEVARREIAYLRSEIFTL